MDPFRTYVTYSHFDKLTKNEESILGSRWTLSVKNYECLGLYLFQMSLLLYDFIRLKSLRSNKGLIRLKLGSFLPEKYSPLITWLEVLWNLKLVFTFVFKL